MVCPCLINYIYIIHVLLVVVIVAVVVVVAAVVVVVAVAVAVVLVVVSFVVLLVIFAQVVKLTVNHRNYSMLFSSKKVLQSLSLFLNFRELHILQVSK